jgi:hypothetical protein
MRLKKYIEFLKEADENQVDVNNVAETDTTETDVEETDSTETEETDNKVDSSGYSEIKDAVKKMIEDTIGENGGEFSDFISKFLKNPKDVKVEKFINDSDIRDFYLKFRNDIDEILNKINFYSETPEDSKAFGLDEYVIKGTERAFKEVVTMLKNQKEG